MVWSHSFHRVLCDIHSSFHINRFTVLDALFLVAFTVELWLRIRVLGLKLIVTTPALFLDFFIVICGLLTEIFIPLILAGPGAVFNTGGGGQSGVLQTLKTLRALRAIRVLRMLTIFADLWYVVQLFFFSLRPLFWTVFFIWIIIFIFTMFSIVLVGRQENSGITDPKWILATEKFEYTISALLTHFQIMTLDEWYGILEPIFEHQPWTIVWFLLYISVSGLALMNMVTASVLESAQKRTREADQELFIERNMTEIEEIIKLTSPLTGDIERQHFIDNYENCWPLQDLGHIMMLDNEDKAGLYDLMDVNQNGTVEPAELAQCYLILRKFLQDTDKVALFRTSQNSRSRMLHIQYALDSSHPVRLANETRNSIGYMQAMVANCQMEIRQLREAAGIADKGRDTLIGESD